MNYKELNTKHFDNFLKNLNSKPSGVLTGFSRIDKVTGGLRPGTMFIIGARPSTGKTSFALNIACNQLKQSSDKIIFFSLEMSAEMILERFFSAENNIDYNKFSHNQLTDKDKTEIQESIAKLKEENRFLIVDNVYDADEIAKIISEEKPILAIVDFIQSVTTEKYFDNTRLRIDYISSLLKRTAKQTKSVVIVLSQITRAGKDEPTMSDLKESGGLEQDGDYIALIHRPYVNDKGSDIKPSKTQILFDKNKFGGTGIVKMTFDLEHQKFYEVTRNE